MRTNALVFVMLSLGCWPAAAAPPAFTDAADFGFSPDATGFENARALQRAVDRAGTIVVSRAGTYRLAATVYIGSNTSLLFGSDVTVKKVAEQGPFTHVLLNKGARTKTWDEHIRVSGLNLVVNGVDVRKWEVYGLHGQIAFFYVRDLEIDHFRCLDLGRAQYAIHVCTFEDILIENLRIAGDKDGVHLGRGRRFTIRDGVFETGDDAIALNAHDYSVGNPELGWIEDGVIENMRDLPNPKRQVGYFCRILAGGWVDWRPGMEVQQSDTVVSEGRLYRVQMDPDGKVYRSTTRPTHQAGQVELDGIRWGVVQDDVTYTAGVRNVVFRDIFLGKARTAFSVHFDNDRYSRSYYPGAAVPRQENLLIENARVLYDAPADFLQIRTPVDTVTIANSTLRNSSISFLSNQAMTDYGKTRINMTGCVFAHPGGLNLLVNRIPNKQVLLKTSGSLELSDSFSAAVVGGGGNIVVESDLTGLRDEKGRRDGNLRLTGATVTPLLPPGPGNPRNTEGAFVTLRDKRILFAYTRFTGGGGDDDAATIVGRYSKDGGRTWSAADVPIVGKEGDMNVMSVSLLRLKDGRIALFYLRKNSTRDCIPYLRYSSDEGATWTEPIRCIRESGYFVLNNDRAVQLAGGRILLPVAQHPPRGNALGPGIAMAYFSDDSGATWRRSTTVLEPPADNRAGYQEPGVVELKDGRVMMFIRTALGSQYLSYSRDRGETWSPPEASDLKSPLSPASIKRIPSTGDLLVVWNDHTNRSGSQRTPLTVAVSRDEGKTWSYRRNLLDDPDGWYCYTAIHFAGRRVLLAFNAGGGGLPPLSRTSLAWFDARSLYR